MDVIELYDQVDTFIKAYMKAALWSSTDIFTDRRLDEMFTTADFSPEALKEIIEDCQKFQEENEDLLELAGDEVQNGHDFWFTRNKFGVGFWSRGYEYSVSEALTKAADEFREQSIVPQGGRLTIE